MSGGAKVTWSPHTCAYNVNKVLQSVYDRYLVNNMLSSILNQKIQFVDDNLKETDIFFILFYVFFFHGN